jgi:carboxypeptidase T
MTSFALRIRSAVFIFGLVFSSAARAGSVSITHDYHKVQAALKALNAKYPKDTELFSLGMSGAGESIDGIKIGHGSVNNLIVATHHGNEYGSTEVALGSAADLAKSPIATQTVWVIPVLNISGFDHDRREESLVGNVDDDNTSDPNRDYPGPCGSEGPFHLKSTMLLADFVDSHNIVASATLHTFYPVVAYPWGFTTPDLSTPYDQLFIDLAKVATSVSNYPIGNSSEAIYPANGTFEDYSFWKHGMWTLLFELGDSHNPSEAQLTELVRVNVPGLRAMMEHAPLIRAADHDFHGRCDSRLRILDRHDE